MEVDETMSPFCFLLACASPPQAMPPPTFSFFSSRSQVTIDDLDEYREAVRDLIVNAPRHSDEEYRWQRVENELDDAETDGDREDIMEDNSPLDE